MTIANRFPGATIIESPWWGYPTVGAPRRVRATILAVDHVADGLSSAADTTRWGIGTKSRSWTFCVDRNGHVVQSLDPVLHVPWTNGDVNQPNLANPRIKAAVESGLNFNEWCFATIECVGTPKDWPITTEQRESLRRIHIWLRDLADLPLNRETVIGHYEVNAIGRTNCPVLPAQRAQFWSDVIPAPLPDTAVPEDAMPKILRRVTGQRATFKVDAPIRRDPKFAATAAFTATAGAVVEPFAVVEGDAYKTGEGTLNEWLAYIDDRNQIDYFPVTLATLEGIGVDQATKDELLVPLKAIERKAIQLADMVREL